MARRYARIGFVGAVWLFVACAVGQVFLAGLGVFGLPAGDFTAHRDWGYTFGYLTLVILILAIVGRFPRRMIGLSALLLVLFSLQSVFVAHPRRLPERRGPAPAERLPDPARGDRAGPGRLAPGPRGPGGRGRHRTLMDAGLVSTAFLAESTMTRGGP